MSLFFIHLLQSCLIHAGTDTIKCISMKMIRLRRLSKATNSTSSIPIWLINRAPPPSNSSSTQMLFKMKPQSSNLHLVHRTKTLRLLLSTCRGSMGIVAGSDVPLNAVSSNFGFDSVGRRTDVNSVHSPITATLSNAKILPITTPLQLKVHPINGLTTIYLKNHPVASLGSAGMGADGCLDSMWIFKTV